jgi:phage tail-like protein
MPDKSSYLQYLPSVLWDREAPAPGFSLGTMLLVFEKILTGLDDGVVIQHNGHDHQAIEMVIANLYQLFDPWFTPPEFLDWLASWVGLKLLSNWDEYQRRKAIAEITQIYWQRGLKTSLSQYLALYTVVETRPRLAIDNGNKILFSQPLPGQSAPVYSLVSQGQFVQNDPVPYTGLIRPWCIAAAPPPPNGDGSLFVGDRGTQGGKWPFQVNSQVWRIGPTGSYTFAVTPGTSVTPLVPQPISPSTWKLSGVVAIAVRNLSPNPLEVYVLDDNGALYQLLPNASQNPITNITQAGATLWSIAMAVDTDNNLLILDRGDGGGTANPPKIIKVQLSPLSITRHNLTQVIWPLSLLVQPNGTLIIGDGRKQQPTNTNLLSPADLPGNLVQVDRSKDPVWNEQVLLSVPNPLVAPTAVVHEDDTHVLVLDVGLKPFVPDINTPFVSQVAESAAVYRVDLNAATVMRAAEPGNLVYPTGMAFSAGSLFICDPGQPETGIIGLGGVSPLLCRVLPHEFGVVVHFCIQRLPQDQQAQDAVRRDILASIRSIVDQEKPAHTLYQLITEV